MLTFIWIGVVLILAIIAWIGYWGQKDKTPKSSDTVGSGVSDELRRALKLKRTSGQNR
jgi:hypothetical protein